MRSATSIGTLPPLHEQPAIFRGGPCSNARRLLELDLDLRGHTRCDLGHRRHARCCVGHGRRSWLLDPVEPLPWPLVALTTPRRTQALAVYVAISPVHTERPQHVQSATAWAAGCVPTVGRCLGAPCRPLRPAPSCPRAPRGCACHHSCHPRRLPCVRCPSLGRLEHSGLHVLQVLLPLRTRRFFCPFGVTEVLSKSGRRGVV